MDAAANRLYTISGGVILLAMQGVPVSATTLRRDADSGRLPAVKASGGMRLFRRCDLETYAAERRGVAVTA